jgi:hypothetical protein
MDSTNTDSLERDTPPAENKHPAAWALPPATEILAATRDQKAILYAETLARLAAAGETNPDLGWLRGMTGVLSEQHAKNAPRLLKEHPGYADAIKAGRKTLPTAGNAWAFLWKRLAKEAPLAPADPTPSWESPIGDSQPDPTPTPSWESPIGDGQLDPTPETAAERVAEPESDAERRRFEELKKIVHSGLKTFLEVGAALAEIRARRFYRFEGYDSFESFVWAEFHLSKPYAYRLMDAVASVDELSTIPGVPAPTNAEQVRPLAGLTPDEKKEVWAESVAATPPGQSPTGATVKKTRAALGKAKPAAKAKPDTTTAVPGQKAGSISLESHVVLVADALEKALAGWKRSSFASLKEAARGNERLSGGLARIEKNLDAQVGQLRGYRVIAS